MLEPRFALSGVPLGINYLSTEWRQKKVLILAVPLPLVFSVRRFSSVSLFQHTCNFRSYYLTQASSLEWVSMYESLRVNMCDEAEGSGDVYDPRDDVSVERSNPERMDSDPWARAASYKKMTVLIPFKSQEIRNLPFGGLASSHSLLDKYISKS